MKKRRAPPALPIHYNVEFVVESSGTLGRRRRRRSVTPYVAQFRKEPGRAAQEVRLCHQHRYGVFVDERAEYALDQLLNTIETTLTATP
jgi:hypothetical protein